jgi:hypothetical protein
VLNNADKKQTIQKIPPFEYADGKSGDIPVLKVFNGPGTIPYVAGV